MKTGALWWRVNGSEYDFNNGQAALDWMDDYLHMPDGMFYADEEVSGPNTPSRGTETCSIVETMFSLRTFYETTGNITFMDRLERLAFNSLPAALWPDVTANVYHHASNQITANTSPWGFQLYFCCSANVHQGWHVHALVQSPPLVDSVCPVSGFAGASSTVPLLANVRRWQCSCKTALCCLPVLLILGGGFFFDIFIRPKFMYSAAQYDGDGSVVISGYSPSTTALTGQHEGLTVVVGGTYPFSDKVQVVITMSKQYHHRQQKQHQKNQENRRRHQQQVVAADDARAAAGVRFRFRIPCWVTGAQIGGVQATPCTFYNMTVQLSTSTTINIEFDNEIKIRTWNTSKLDGQEEIKGGSIEVHRGALLYALRPETHVVESVINDAFPTIKQRIVDIKGGVKGNTTWAGETSCVVLHLPVLEAPDKKRSADVRAMLCVVLTCARCCMSFVFFPCAIFLELRFARL